MIAYAAGGLYLAILAVLAVYGGHRSYLVYKCWALRKQLAELKDGLPPLSLDSFAQPEKLPYVTVQLAIYNEATVASGFDVSLLAASRLGDVLTATASEVSRAGRTGVYDVSVSNQRGEAVAVFRGRSHSMKGKAVVEGLPVGKAR